ncbi:type 1 glutamine amidotransferase domain-containing protein [Shewanella zhangzhouensis]|uniref:type 1 glutamine amidotransferase domain-containing protein n=1 Tax=Shewanella zhangzhouensis TaxID=2864213 RepID=UPI001C659498|nr:type 1 glutamine amidotransferase domain-containing protein [Shewanella zhangzhouensis]QYK07025.1 type 1 glutamine amidotransferase domain-containing protein [Shewanella zhangzhouensis]
MTNTDEMTSPKKRVAIVISNPATSTVTQWPVGFWWSEVSHPYFEFTDNGYEVEFFSPEGGKVEADSLSDPTDKSGYSAADEVSLKFINSSELMALLENTKPVSSIDTNAFDAILVAGGQSPMFSFAQATSLHRKFVEFYEKQKITAALCHGVAVLKYARLSNGEMLVKGKKVTGFTNEEESHSDAAVWEMGALPKGVSLMPWRIEDDLSLLGAEFVKADPWNSHAVKDGNLITGQQNMSGLQTAQLIIESLEK